MIEKSTVVQGNILLGLLPADESRRILASAERVTLSAHDLIADAERPIEHVYFPLTCVLSVLSVMTDRSAVETAVIGSEGMAPLTAFHGVPVAAEQIIVQVPGDALRLTVSEFQSALRQAPELRALLHRFSQALFTFTAQASGCNRRHTVVQRCARWLLLTHDRVAGNEFPLTHVFLSQMLGVRRSSVTLAAEALRAAGAVAYTRGAIRIISRERLQERACECYAIVRATYDRLFDRDAEMRSPLEDLTLSDGRKSIAGPVETGEHEVPSDPSALMTEQALGEFSAQLRAAQERATRLREAWHDASLQASIEKADQELSLVLEQLMVAEEELRVQMEALGEMRLALEEQRQQWQARIDALPDAFVETDRHHVIVEVNRAAEELLGRPRGELVGTPLLVFVPESKRRGLRDVVSELTTRGASAGWIGVVLGPERVERRVDVTVAAASQGIALKGAEGKRPLSFTGARWLFRRERVAGGGRA